MRNTDRMDGFAVLCSTVSLTEYLSDVLITYALRLHFSDKTSLMIREEGVEGMIRATGKVVTIGSYFGHEFTVEMDTDRGLSGESITGKVKFINTITCINGRDVSAPASAAN